MKKEEETLKILCELAKTISDKEKLKKNIYGGEMSLEKTYSKKDQLDKEKRFKKVLIGCKKIAKENCYELEKISLLDKKKYSKN